MDIEAGIMWAAAVGAPVLLVWLAAHGRPKRIGRVGYLVTFAVLLIVDTPILTGLYITPRRSPRFDIVDFAGDIALLIIPIAFSCLLCAIVYGRLSKKTQTATPPDK